MAAATRVLLIEDNRIEARQTQHWLSAASDPPFEVECVDRLQVAIERLARGGFDIVLLDLNLPDSRGLDTFVTLHEQVPQVPVVVLTGEFDETIGPLAVEKGAQDYLVKQGADASTLTRVLRHAIARNRAFTEGMKQTQKSKTGRVLGLVGAKGGVGTTTTALNIAQSLAHQGKSVVLVELRPFFGTLSCHLNRKPSSNLGSLLEMPLDQIGERQLASVLAKGLDGLQILFGPQKAEEFRDIEAAQADAIVKGMSHNFEFVVLDLPNQPSEATRAAVNLCEFVAIVAESESASVQAGRTLVDHLRSCGIQGGLVGAVIVHRDALPFSMSFSEVQSTLGCQIVAMVPYAGPACLRALSEGSPLVVSQRDNEAAMNLAEIASKFAANKLLGMTL